MPTVQIEGFKFRFYATDWQEPPHMHVLRGGDVAKIWLSPISVAYNYGYNDRELGRILRLAQQHQEQLLEVWHDYFSR